MTDIALVELHKVFQIDHGSKLDLNKMTLSSGNEAVAFVNRSGERNGISRFVSKLSGREPYAAGLITVALGGAALSSFVQPRPFYTSQNVDVLTPLKSMSLDEKLYYCQCIEANKFRYSTFGREANRSLRNLLVPDRKSVPVWVAGITARSVQELNADLLSVSAGLTP